MTSEVLIIALIVSIIFFELTNLTPGGIIVPGLMVLYITSPLRMLYTLLIAIVSYFIVRLLSKRFIIFGKRRFVLLIIISLLLNLVVNLIFGIVAWDFSNSAIYLVGYSVAGIIANNMHKQGVIKTTISLGIVIGITELIILLLVNTGILI